MSNVKIDSTTWTFDLHFNFQIKDHEGMPYCETHYHSKRGSLCAGCSKPITGRCITAMFRKFHPEHFVCAFCLKQLNKGEREMISWTLREFLIKSYPYEFCVLILRHVQGTEWQAVLSSMLRQVIRLNITMMTTTMEMISRWWKNKLNISRACFRWAME